MFGACKVINDFGGGGGSYVGGVCRTTHWWWTGTAWTEAARRLVSHHGTDTEAWDFAAVAKEVGLPASAWQDVETEAYRLVEQETTRLVAEIR